MAIKADIGNKYRVLQKLLDIENGLNYSITMDIPVIPEIKTMASTLDAENLQIGLSYDHSRDWINKMVNRLWVVQGDMNIQQKPSILL